MRQAGTWWQAALDTGARRRGGEAAHSSKAFRRAGLDPDFYSTRGYGVDELLPWQTIDVGVTTNFLLREREKALRSESTPDCRTHCNGCGARRLSERGLCDESPAV